MVTAIVSVPANNNPSPSRDGIVTATVGSGAENTLRPHHNTSSSIAATTARIATHSSRNHHQAAVPSVGCGSSPSDTRDRHDHHRTMCHR